MRQTPWHTTLAKLTAATAVVVGAMTALVGCGNGGPDQQVHKTLTDARVETAAGGEDALRKAQKDVEAASVRTDASDVVQAQAKSVLGQLYYEAALDGIRDLDRHEIEASRLALEVVELGRQIDLSRVLVDGY